MNRTIFTFLVFLLLFSGCKSNNGPVESTNVMDSFEERNGVAVIQSLPAATPIVLCEQEITSRSAIEDSFDVDYDIESYFIEATTAEEAFYLPNKDIVGQEMVKNVQMLFNTVSLANRVAHSYELFHRATWMVEGDSLSRRDTLEIIRETQPILSDSLLSAAFPDARVLSAAKRLKRAYAEFNGDDSEDSLFSQSYGQYVEYFQSLPQVASEAMLDHFEKGFWSWYDKRQFVPAIDAIIRINMQDSVANALSEEQLSHFRAVVLSEPDIDRRAILALEYAKFDHWNGSVLLGEILESKRYTRYILECWIAWRLYVQDTHGLSSFSIIANNYYDKVKALCADTYVRHCLETNDENAKCLLQNLLYCEILHRQAYLYGNEVFAGSLYLCSEEFIDPRLRKSLIDSTFFGVDLSLPIDNYLKVLNEQPDIDVDFDSFRGQDGRAFCIVSLCGIPLGMNLQYDKEKIQSATHVTSRKDESVIEKIVSVLTKYHGEADIADQDESQYTWFLGERMLKARHLHTEEGGWTIILTD